MQEGIFYENAGEIPVVHFRKNVCSETIAEIPICAIIPLENLPGG
jgi:hypothetical protein